MTVVYKHIRNDNGNPFYIGIGNEARPYIERGRNPIWKYIVNEETDYTVEIIKKSVSLKYAQQIETELIKKWGRIDTGTGVLANRTDGGATNETLEWYTPLPYPKYKKYSERHGHELTHNKLTALLSKLNKYKRSGDTVKLESVMSRLTSHQLAIVKRIKQQHNKLDRIEKQEAKILQKYYRSFIRRLKREHKELDRIEKQEAKIYNTWYTARYKVWKKQVKHIENEQHTDYKLISDMAGKRKFDVSRISNNTTGKIHRTYKGPTKRELLIRAWLCEIEKRPELFDQAPSFVQTVLRIT